MCIVMPSMGNNQNLSEGEKEEDNILIEEEGQMTQYEHYDKKYEV